MTHFPSRFAGFIKQSRRITSSIVKHPIVITSLLVTGLVVGVREFGGTQAWELVTYDQMMRIRPEREPDPRLVIVTITEEDIRAQNRWPLSDEIIATLLERLQQYQPRTIGLDIYRDVPHLPGHQKLQQALQAPNVIAIKLLGDLAKEGVPAPLSVPEDRVGLSDIVVDPDAVVRRNFLYATADGTEFYSFALRLSLHYLSQQRKQPIQFQVVSQQGIQIGSTFFPSLSEDSGSYETLDDRGYQILLDYRSTQNVARQVSLGQVLSGKADPAWFKNKLVLIGTTAPSARDFFLTPYNLANDKSPEMPGVVVHAQQEIIWIFAWATLGGILAWRLRHPLSLGLAGIISVGGLFAICYGVFLQGGWIPFIPPVLVLVGTGIAMITYRLLYDALHDELTGLPNRALFVNQLQWTLNRRNKQRLQKKANPHAIAVLFLGLDSFKTINDSFGHRLADKLLVTMSKRLKQCLRSKDQLARVGGDEFAVLLRNVRDADEVADLANHLQKQIKIPLAIDSQEIVTTASVGIVIDPPDSQAKPEDILRDANTAMNQAKISGKARSQVFVSGMRTQVMTRLQLETDLRRAIERQEFQLHYQPFICLEDGKIAGFEALLRWNHPQRGFVHPVEFIPVAEETDLIIPIGQWVIQEACAQLNHWNQTLTFENPLIISVNLSSKQFAQVDLVEQIEQTLEQTGLDGHSLKLEITESIAMTDVETTISLLMRLKALNLQISIDDFGTGYSSLSYLHRFPTDTIKVDRSFVSRMGDESEDAHIVQTIIMLGHNLGMNIVAEGVETPDQLARLRSLKCEYGQGYYFSRPIPHDAAERLLKSDPSW